MEKSFPILQSIFNINGHLWAMVYLFVVSGVEKVQNMEIDVGRTDRMMKLRMKMTQQPRWPAESCE